MIVRVADLWYVGELQDASAPIPLTPPRYRERIYEVRDTPLRTAEEAIEDWKKDTSSLFPGRLLRTIDHGAVQLRLFD